MKALDNEFNGGPYTYGFYLDELAGFVEIYIENEGVEPAPEDWIEEIIRENIGDITDIYVTELGMGEYSFQIICEYTPL